MSSESDYFSECCYEESESEDSPGPVGRGDPEVWQDRWREDIMDAWYALCAQRDVLAPSVLDRCTLADFAHFCWEHSDEGTPVRRDAPGDAPGDDQWLRCFRGDIKNLWRGSAISERCTLADFTAFCRHHSSGHIPPA